MFLRLVHRLQPIILLVAFGAVVWVLYRQWPALSNYPWRLHLGWFGAAVLLTGAAWVVEIWLWVRLICLLGGARLPMLAAIRIWFLSAVVRYVPGNVWQPLSLTLYAHRRGIPVEITITSLLLFQALILITALPIAALFAAQDGAQSILAQLMGPSTTWVLAALLSVGLMLLWRPDWLMRGVNLVLVRMGRQPMPAQLSRRGLLLLALVATGHWLIWGGAFAAFAFAVVGDGIVDRSAVALQLVASFAIAYAIGFLSFITPSGFGVREGAFYLLLVPRIDGAVVTVIALGMRAWTTIGEVLLALLSAPFERGGAAPAAQEPPASDEPAVAVGLRRELT